MMVHEQNRGGKDSYTMVLQVFNQLEKVNAVSFFKYIPFGLNAYPDEVHTHSDKKINSYFCNCVRRREEDRKSTRLNSSHSQISHAVFCFKKRDRRASRVPQQPAGGPPVSCPM